MSFFFLSRTVPLDFLFCCFLLCCCTALHLFFTREIPCFFLNTPIAASRSSRKLRWSSAISSIVDGFFEYPIKGMHPCGISGSVSLGWDSIYAEYSSNCLATNFRWSHCCQCTLHSAWYTNLLSEVVKVQRSWLYRTHLIEHEQFRRGLVWNKVFRPRFFLSDRYHTQTHLHEVQLPLQRGPPI